MLEHPLAGPLLRVTRAERQIEALRRVEEDYWRDSGCRIIKAESDLATNEQIYRVLIDAVPSIDWGICVGEIAHNLRSALDGLIWQLASPKARAEGRTQFPIYLIGRPVRGDNGDRSFFMPRRTKAGTLRKAGGRGRGQRMLEGLEPRHQTRIEQLQPYKRGKGGAKSNLWLLNCINNADKHRLLLVTAASLGAVSTGIWGDDHKEALDWHTWHFGVPLKDGAEIGRAPLPFAEKVGVYPNITPLVAFDEGCAEVEGRRVITVLHLITEEVRSILESFVPDFPEVLRPRASTL